MLLSSREDLGQFLVGDAAHQHGIGRNQQAQSVAVVGVVAVIVEPASFGSREYAVDRGKGVFDDLSHECLLVRCGGVGGLAAAANPSTGQTPRRGYTGRKAPNLRGGRG